MQSLIIKTRFYKLVEESFDYKLAHKRSKNYLVNYFYLIIYFFSLPSGLQIGRSNTQQVAERRKVDIEKFLVSLFKMADEIAHSDIVYTFFHPLLRDEEEEVDINRKKVKGTKANFIIHYSAFIILKMIHFFL